MNSGATTGRTFVVFSSKSSHFVPLWAQSSFFLRNRQLLGPGVAQPIVLRRSLSFLRRSRSFLRRSRSFLRRSLSFPRRSSCRCCVVIRRFCVEVLVVSESKSVVFCVAVGNFCVVLGSLFAFFESLWAIVMFLLPLQRRSGPVLFFIWCYF